MCLAVPVRVKSLAHQTARVEVDGIVREVSILLTPDIQVGQYALLHAGFTLSILDEEEAKQTLGLLEELGESLE